MPYSEAFKREIPTTPEVQRLRDAFCDAALEEVRAEKETLTLKIPGASAEAMNHASTRRAAASKAKREAFDAYWLANLNADMAAETRNTPPPDAAKEV